MTDITFDTLPSAVAEIQRRLTSIERLLIERDDPQPTETDRWFDIRELCEYLPDRPTVPTVYGWVHFRKIPVHKGGKKLRFLKSEIDAWLKQGKQKSLAETEAEARKFLQR